VSEAHYGVLFDGASSFSVYLRTMSVWT